MKFSISFYGNKDITRKGKLVTNLSCKYRCRNPCQKVVKSNIAIHKKDDASKLTGVYPRNAGLCKYPKINQNNFLY